MKHAISLFVALTLAVALWIAPPTQAAESVTYAGALT